LPVTDKQQFSDLQNMQYTDCCNIDTHNGNLNEEAIPLNRSIMMR